MYQYSVYWLRLLALLFCGVIYSTITRRGLPNSWPMATSGWRQPRQKCWLGTVRPLMPILRRLISWPGGSVDLTVAAEQAGADLQRAVEGHSRAYEIHQAVVERIVTDADQQARQSLRGP